MELKKMIDRFFLDMVINELRLANFNDFQHVTYNSLFCYIWTSSRTKGTVR